MIKFHSYHIVSLLFLSSFIYLSCNKKMQAAEKTKTLVFIVNLVDDEQKINEYMAYHHMVWPEVEAGFRRAGYKNINIYRFNKSLVMSITVPENADLDRMNKTAEGYNKKCKEWNQIMDHYQVGVPGTSEGQKWAKTELIYSFKNK